VFEKGHFVRELRVRASGGDLQSGAFRVLGVTAGPSVPALETRGTPSSADVRSTLGAGGLPCPPTAFGIVEAVTIGAQDLTRDSRGAARSEAGRGVRTSSATPTDETKTIPREDGRKKSHPAVAMVSRLTEGQLTCARRFRSYA
jgi:hypothetical protein